MENKSVLETLIVKKLSGSLAEAEADELAQRLANDTDAQKVYLEFQEIWNASARREAPPQRTTEERWNGLQEKMRAEAPAIGRKKYAWLRYAAVLGALVMLAAIYRYKTTGDLVTIATIGDEIRNFSLPDGSMVTMNAGSSVQYDPSDWTTERKVRLQGKAFFSVKKNGKDFTVQSSNATVTVLGTTFNVEAKDRMTTVTCLTGRVRVDNKSHEHRVILEHGSEVFVDGDQLSGVYAANSERAMAWMNGELDFRNKPLKEVLKVLGHYYDRQIIVKKEMDSLTFTGNFESSSLKNALQTISLSAGLKFTIGPDSTIVVE